MSTSKRICSAALTCALWISALSGCVSQTGRPESPRPVVPANLLRECPKPVVPADSSTPAALRAYLQATRLYRICAERHRDLKAVVTKPSNDASTQE